MSCGGGGKSTAIASRNVIEIGAPRETVYARLCDPASYPDWVVGAKAVRGTDARWPGRGGRIFHRVGLGPIEIEDQTQIVQSDPPSRLLLEASIGPAGAAYVDLRLDDLGGNRTRVTMVENGTRGLMARAPSPVADAALHVRNALSLRNLKRLCEQGPTARRPAAGHG